MDNQKNSKFTQNYPTERKDYDKVHKQAGLVEGREPSEGGEETIDEALTHQGGTSASVKDEKSESKKAA